jgi:hypothetical protein
MFKRILKTLTVTLALFAVFTGSAAAMVMVQQSDFGTTQSSRPIVSEKLAGLNPATQVQVQPIVSEKVAGLQPVSPSERPLVSEKVAGLRLSQPEVTLAASTGGGFDWNDAGIGAGVAFAALLAAMVGTMTLRRHHGQIAH